MKKWAGSGFPSKKGQDGGINRKKLAGKWDLRTLLWTLISHSPKLPLVFLLHNKIMNSRFLTCDS